uniref:Uncharacterized protein n=1 Tax=Terrapene triunguis TaxID=2587831 RepID=A0A674IRZ6_9SAUR
QKKSKTRTPEPTVREPPLVHARGDWELAPLLPPPYLSQSGSEARLSQPRSHLSRAAAKSRCTTSKSAASSSKEVAGAGTGDKDRGSLLLRKPAGPLSPAEDTGKSFFMVPGEWRLLASGLGYVPLNPVPDLLRSHPVTARTPRSGGAHVCCVSEKLGAWQSSPPTRSPRCAPTLCRGLWEL